LTLIARRIWSLSGGSSIATAHAIPQAISTEPWPNLQAEIYRVPVEKLMEHARLRGEAIRIRDTRAESGGVKEEDWARIGDLLRESWRSLRNAVNS
jgi:hypothetical protein